MGPDIPSYVDLGKQVHDILTKGYHFGYWKFDCKTKTNKGTEFITCAQSSPIQPKVYGAFAIKHRINSRYLTLTEKWCTFDTVIAKLETEDNSFKLMMEALCNYVLGNGKAKIALSYGRYDFKADTDLNFNSYGLLVNASIVLRFGHWFAGYQTAIKEQSSELSPHNFAITYHAFDGDVFHASMSTDMIRDRTDCIVSYLKHCSDKLDLGVQVSWTSSVDSYAKIGLGILKHLHEGDIFRAMINRDRQIGIGYQLAFLDGFNIFLSVLIDSKNAKTQFGVAVEMEA